MKIAARWAFGGLMLAATLPLLSPAASGPDGPSPQGTASFQALIESGRLDDLRWPDFSDYVVHVRNFYAPAGYPLAWLQNGQPTPQTLAVIRSLEDADSKGLHAEDYDGPRWPERLARLRQTTPPPTEAELARFDLALTVSLMRYISDLHIGKVNPRHFKFDLDIEHKKYNLPDLLRQRIVAASDVESVLAQVEPQFPGYRRAQQALIVYRRLAAADHNKPLPVPAKPVHAGEPYPSTEQLAARLKLLGDLPAAAAEQLPGADPGVYPATLLRAVRHFQLRHGLEPDGVLGRKTVEELNTPLRQRALQLELALERWRWIPPDFSQPPIVVNIPEFRLRAFNARQQAAFTCRVVVGKAYQHETPVLAAEMRFLIFRPYWEVPVSIERAEVVPRIVRDRSYLTKHRYEVVNARNQPVEEGKVSNETLKRLRLGELYIRQKPGPENSLGLVKFIFPNSHSVYLHGTPATELFAKERRDFSHGCIRVGDPSGLAAWVLRDKPGWTADRIRAAMTTGPDNSRVDLDRPIPVLIIYSTAVVEPDGTVEFFDDIYGYDQELEQVLARGYPYPG